MSVTTHHYDNARTGQNTSETTLAPANINFNQFGKLFALAVDGQVYAQPLYVPNVTIPGKGLHNVIYVATEVDSVFAFDADSVSGANSSPLWQASLLDTAHGAPSGATYLTGGDVNCSDLTPNVGITSTPVIDPSSGKLYVEARSKENGLYVHRLHVLDITTGAEVSPGPVTITATVSGTGDGSSNGQLTFGGPSAEGQAMALTQNSRPGLLLSNGTVFLGYASLCDNSPYHGWLFAYNASTLAQTAVYVTTPNGGLGGIWMAGSGIAADSSGNLFIPTGNGTFDTTNIPATELGDSILKLSLSGNSFSLLDYFTPYSQASLNSGDVDLGSGGLLLLPDQPGNHPHELVQAGKDGTIHLIDRDQMTSNPNNPGAAEHYCKGCNSDPQIVQEFQSVLGGMWAMPAYWNNFVYFWGSGDSLKAYSLTNGLLSTSPTSQSSTSVGSLGVTPAVSANGNTNGIVWGILANSPAELHAYDATNVATELYNSNQAPHSRDVPGSGVKFTPPVIVNGKVYVSTSSAVVAYGLLLSAPTITTQPANQTVTAGQTATFSAVASGSPAPTVQWQVSTNGGTTFSNLSGATSTTLSFTAASSQNGYEYQAVFTNSSGSATTAAATLTVNPAAAPSITTQPANQTLTAGQTATFTAAASGSPAPTVQWQVSTNGGSTFSNLSGATSPTLSFTAASSQNGYEYQAVFTNSLGSATTSAATLTVNTVPAITTQPANQTVTAGQTATFTAAASGSPAPMVQWQVSTNGGASFSNLSGATSTTLSFTASSTQNGNQYRAVFTNAAGSATTAAATLTVNPANTPPTITTQPANQTVTAGQMATFSVVAGGTSPLTYQWQKVVSGVASNISGANSSSYTTPATQLSDSGSGFQVVVTNAYGSATSNTATLTVNPASSSVINFSSGFPSTSGLSMNGGAVLSGTRVRLTDGNTNEARSVFYTTPVNVQSFTNNFSFQLTNPIGDGITFVIQDYIPTAVGPVDGGIAYGPNSPGGTPGIPMSLAVKFDTYNNAGEGSDSTGMYTNGASPTIPAIDMTSSGVDLHSGDVMNVQMTYDGTTLTWTITDSVTGKSFTASQAVNIPAVVQSSTAYVGFTGSTGYSTSTQDILTWTYSTNGSYVPPVQYEPENLLSSSVSSGAAYSASSWSGFTDGKGTTLEGGQVGNNVTITLNVPQAGIYDVQVATENHQNRAKVQLAVNGTNIGPAMDLYYSTAFWQKFDLGTTNLAAGNQPFTFTVVGKNASSGGYYVVLDYIRLIPSSSTPTPPVITTPPANQTVTAGQTATFTAAASGSPTPSVQWQVSTNGGTTFSNLSGATSPTLSFTTSSVQNGNQYQAVFTNASGSATTTAATLTVNSPPAIITPPANQTVTAGQTATFTAAASGSPTPTVQWQVSTNGGTTFSNVSGATSPTLSFTAASSQNGYKYQAVFTNSTGSATTTAATLTVNTAPAITTQPASQTVTAGQTATFTAAASGSPTPTVQWQVSTNGGTTFSNLSGATSATWSFTAASSQSGYKYQAVFTNAAGSATTTAATLTVNTAPAITTQPANQTVTAGQTATFTAAASGSPAPTVQWQVSTNGGSTFSNLSGATSTTLSFSASITQNSYEYQAVFTNAAGSATTAAATLTVNPASTPPTITTQPANQTVTAGQMATFSVAASGTSPLTYQWQKVVSGVASNISGANSSSYTTPATQLSDSGSGFQVIVTNAYGSATSNAATLTVNAVAPTVINFGSGFPSSSGLSLNGGAVLSGTRVRLTDGNTNEARSVFYTTPVNVQSFSNSFSFQLANPNGDGITFTIQGYTPGAQAVGSSDGGLGYGPQSAGLLTGIPLSVAVKFDLYNNAGEGTDSTGLYTLGAAPTVPAMDMTSSGVNLHSGDVMNVQMTYDGTTLTWTITDSVTGKSFTASQAINIPSIVQSTTAYVGFTGSTGSATATQDIVTWTYGTSGPAYVAPLQYETEALLNSSVSSGALYQEFPWSGFTDGDGSILWATAVGQKVTITLNVPQAGNYEVQVATRNRENRANVQLSVNGTNVGPPMDQYYPVAAWQQYDLGIASLTAGNQAFTFTVVGADPASNGFYSSMDYIRLIPH